MPPVTFEQAIHLLHMHKHQMHGLGQAPGKTWRRPPTLQELTPGIVRKWNALLRGGALGEEVQEKDRAQWARRRG